MKQTLENTKIESVKSFQSTIRKMEKSLDVMEKKEANTTLIRRRLDALRVGLEVLEHVWYGKDLTFHFEELINAREVLMGLLPSIENAYLKSKEGSPQRTLLKRRITSIEQSITNIQELIMEYEQ